MMTRRASFRQRQAEANNDERSIPRTRKASAVAQEEVMALVKSTHQKIPGWRRRALLLQAHTTRGRLRGRGDLALVGEASDLLAEIGAEQAGLAERAASSSVAVNSSLVADTQTVLRSIASSIEMLV